MTYSEYCLYLYRIFNNQFPKTVVIPNDGWRDFILLCYEFFNQPFPEFRKCENLPEITFEPNNNLIFGYSGGRDSLAAVLKLRETYNVKLFHLLGVNKSYRNESNVVKQVSETLGLKCFFEKMPEIKRSDYVENPVKNFYIQSLMIDGMLESGISNLSMGLYTSDTLQHKSQGNGFSDFTEPLKLFEKAVQETFKSFKFLYAFESQADAVFWFLKNHRDKINLLQSCLLPDRFRNDKAQINHKKFNLEILPNRCGCSCTKCIQELIQVSILDSANLDKDLYDHCIKFLREKLKADFGIRYSTQEIKGMTDSEVLSQYFDFKRFRELCKGL